MSIQSNSAFSDLIEMQKYMDGRGLSKALSDVQIDNAKSMSKDMALGNQLDRLAKWQSMYNLNKEKNPKDNRTLSVFIKDMQALLALV